MIMMQYETLMIFKKITNKNENLKRFISCQKWQGFSEKEIFV